MLCLTHRRRYRNSDDMLNILMLCRCVPMKDLVTLQWEEKKIVCTHKNEVMFFSTVGFFGIYGLTDMND